MATMQARMESAKRRLSLSGRSDAQQRDEQADQEMASPANDDSIQMQIEGVRQIAEEALMSTQHLAKDYNANQVTISQWNGNTTQTEFWTAYQELTELEFFDELVKSGELVLVNDKKPMEVTLTLFKASRCHSCMQQIVQIIYDYNLPLMCTHTVPTGKRNLMRTARVAFQEYAKEIQGDPKVLIKTKGETQQVRKEASRLAGQSLLEIVSSHTAVVTKQRKTRKPTRFEPKIWHHLVDCYDAFLEPQKGNDDDRIDS